MKYDLVIIKILLINSSMLLSTGLETAAQGLNISPTNSINLGVFAAESDQTACFKFSNPSARTIVIRKVESCCAYMQPIVYMKKIEPGKSVPLDVSIDGNSLSGKFRKKIDVETSAADGAFSLWVEGTARPAIVPSADRIFVNRLPLNRSWSTNITVRTRRDIHTEPEAEVRSVPALDANITRVRNNSFNLELSLPAKKKPMILQGTVVLTIDGKPNLRPVSLPFEGCIGGRLHTVPGALTVNRDSGGLVSFTLYRYAPESVRLLNSSLRSNHSQIRIIEKKNSEESSSVTLHLSPAFIQQLNKEKRIPLELSAEGFVPATLMLILAP